LRRLPVWIQLLDVKVRDGRIQLQRRRRAHWTGTIMHCTRML
jgi:hypothetical protein